MLAKRLVGVASVRNEAVESLVPTVGVAGTEKSSEG